MGAGSSARAGDFFRSFGDAVGSGLDIFKDVGETLTGHTADYGNIARSGRNIGIDIANAGGAGLQRDTGPLSAAQIQQNALNAQMKTSNYLNDPNSGINAGLHASYQAAANAAGFGANAPGPMKGQQPPSNLNNISDPATKIAQATLRGGSKVAFQSVQAKNNIGMANAAAAGGGGNAQFMNRIKQVAAAANVNASGGVAAAAPPSSTGGAGASSLATPFNAAVATPAAATNPSLKTP